MPPNLKNQNQKWLLTFTGLCALGFSLVLADSPPDMDWIESVWEKLSSRTGIAAAVTPFAALILSNLFSSESKACLVFWRLKHPLPGTRAFSQLAKLDPRISIERIRKAAGGRLPRNPEKQNELWYRWSKKHAEKPSVMKAHKDYLLTRDMTAITWTTAVAMALLFLLDPEPREHAFKFYSFQLVAFLAVSTAARNIGNRFVQNVLAEESIEVSRAG